MNPQQFAALAAKFLSRAMLSPMERAEFAAVENVLRDIAQGKLTIGEPPKADTLSTPEPAK